jgi:hypothetical protein
MQWSRIIRAFNLREFNHKRSQKRKKLYVKNKNSNNAGDCARPPRSSMERGLKITRGITDVLKPYQEMLAQLKRQQRQLTFTMFFKKTRAADEPTQSTSRAEPEPTTSSTTRSPSPKPVPESPGPTSSSDYPLTVLSEED